MKKKEIIITIISLVTVGVSIYFILQMLFPNDTNTTESLNDKESEKIPNVQEKFDEKTYEEIQSLKDYGVPGIEEVGKSNLFSE